MDNEKQMNLFDYVKPHKLEIIGICDDGYCPNCGRCVDYPEENIDSEYCPNCGYGLDWSQWHEMNDEE